MLLGDRAHPGSGGEVELLDAGPEDEIAARSAATITTSVDRHCLRAAAQEEQRSTPPDAATAYRAISPSLVTVTTERSVADTGGAAGGTELGLGAGVVINARGAVLTALHVVEDGGQIRVRFADGTRASARVPAVKLAFGCGLT